MASRKLSDLHPYLLPLANKFLDDCKKDELDILVTCTYRNNKEQDILYNEGRLTPGRIVTNAKGGQSEHNFTIEGKAASKAFDIVPLIHGKCDWDTWSPRWGKIREIWNNQKPIGGYYLDWYGRTGAPFVEYPHFCVKRCIDEKK